MGLSRNSSTTSPSQRPSEKLPGASPGTHAGLVFAEPSNFKAPVHKHSRHPGSPGTGAPCQSLVRGFKALGSMCPTLSTKAARKPHRKNPMGWPSVSPGRAVAAASLAGRSSWCRRPMGVHAALPEPEGQNRCLGTSATCFGTVRCLKMVKRQKNTWIPPGTALGRARHLDRLHGC